MECTQKLEYSQEVLTQPQKLCPEQIGFLGICGEVYPIVKGPNKIGRDPQTCKIILNLNSISRQHAVINVLNQTQFMLMDLDSSNKTKLEQKVLQAYIPYPLKNGDTVQFGDVFGIFRLLEDNDELPMTQAITDLPDTPIQSHQKLKSNHATTTIIPESPDISDKETSFIGASQPKRHHFNSPSSKYIKPPGKTIAIQPIGINKIDNVFWNSSKKSCSLNISESDTDNTVNEENPARPVRNNGNNNYNNGEFDIHERETQEVPLKQPEIDDSIYTASTQLLTVQDSKSLVEINTLKKCDQLSLRPVDKLPEVQKIKQLEIEFSLHTSSKDNNNSIYNVETQLISSDAIINNNEDMLGTSKRKVEDDEILFDDIDNESFIDDIVSQTILPDDKLQVNKNVENSHSASCVDDKTSGIIDNHLKTNINTVIDVEAEVEENCGVHQTDINFLNDEDSTDCEDNECETPNLLLDTTNKVSKNIKNTNILPTEKLSCRTSEHDATDCQDRTCCENNTSNINAETINEAASKDFETTEISDKEDTVLKYGLEPKNGKQFLPEDAGVNLEDMLTQVLEEPKDIDDLPTQIVLIDNVSPCIQTEQQYSEEIVRTFKIPLSSPRSIKKKELVKPMVRSDTPRVFTPRPDKFISNDDFYYAATQDIYDDLCSQKTPISKEIDESNQVKEVSISRSDLNDSRITIQNKGINVITNKITENYSDGKNQRITNSVCAKEVQDIVVENNCDLEDNQKPLSDISDVDHTPKKFRQMKLMETVLPDSQDIKKSITLTANAQDCLKISSESDSENDGEEYTPILYKAKKKSKKQINEAKINLTKYFEDSALPSRKSSRQKKPTLKLLSNESNNKVGSIIKSNFSSETLSDTNNEIITENMSRLQNNCFNTSNKNIKSSNKKIKTIDFSKKDTQKELKNLENGIKKEEIKYSNKPIKRSTRNCRKQMSLETELEQKKTQVMKKSKIENIFDLSPELTVLRRSNRQKRTMDPKTHKLVVEKCEKEPKSILKNKSEHSNSLSPEICNYSVSSSSLKRATRVDELDIPTKKAKRINTSVDNYSSKRSTPTRSLRTINILFTAFAEPAIEEISSKLEKLGAVIVQDVESCTVLVAHYVKRTFKLLCAVSLGKPIVGLSWIKACHDTNMLVDPWMYLLKDEEAEKRYKFNLQRTLKGRRNFLSGYCVSSTPNVRPPRNELEAIVKKSGGNWNMKGGSQWVCVSCLADKRHWAALKKRGATIVHSEFILTGVLRQEADIPGNLLK